ncbi:WD repeat containing protein 44 [Cordyceps fumosorosea ARSEF 2679]|uniref:WD repeat containing protein 44 n=1 Tax=Cordyceps fumosorosea (strain ARSEF 2679) TaxID=1081104 RepID=A0A167LJU5_CORFA|nr:WD repeat containing protein 44 [Cordyceps fumosorosea ARSEF 2679]OAA53173.1 WD repeat containing protein 44 [Cordyceps fumosorosea ARSEF 2679]
MTTDVSSPSLASDLHSAREQDRRARPPTKSPSVDENANESLSPILSRRPTSKHSRSVGPPVTKENPSTKNTLKPSTSNQGHGSGLDPLSTQIYLRTNSSTEPTIAQRLLNAGRPDSPAPDSIGRLSHDSNPSARPDSIKERKKGPSFLSRLSIRAPFRKEDDADSDSDFGEHARTDGTNARALTTVMGAGGGYLPMHKEPPRYIRVKAHNKKSRSFNHLFLAQELSSAKKAGSPSKHAPATVVGSKILKGGNAIWAAEFSIDGRYLAVAGMDHVVRVYAVLSTPEERRAYEEEQEQDDDEKDNRSKHERLSAPVFRSEPIREFEGHGGEVLALSWSKNNFLLSSSMDKTVQLWHLSRQESLCTFKHDDLVTSISFHPTDDRFFLAGSLDEQLRLWSIPDKAVAFSTQTGEFITAVAFTPNGKTAICGLLSGICIFYETEGLQNPWQIHVRSSRGKNAKGSKITGIRTKAVLARGFHQADVKVLISSNDSRVRIYSLKTRMLEAKFKGHENMSSQIHARFSDDGQFVTSGSEDRKAYIWDISHHELEVRDKQPYECFDAHPEVVTVALMAPIATKQLLGASGDPIYDLCNPPPVTLMSLSEATVSQSALSEVTHSDVPGSVRKQTESPAYLERSKHKNGNIIITADRKGIIKVFRQDCAAVKRHQSLWETGSKFSGKVAGGVGRSSSLATRTSGGSRVHSRRGSLSTSGSLVPSQIASDRIMSWRQDIEGGRASVGTPTTRSERSISPSKSVVRSPLNVSASNLASEARKQPYIATPPSRKRSNSNLQRRGRTTSAKPDHIQVAAKIKDPDKGPTIPPTPSFSLVSASDPGTQEDGRDGSFWNLSRWRGGISGLRNVTNSSAVAEMPNTNGSHRTSTSTERSGHEHRRSVATNDTRRLAASGDESARRRSILPGVSVSATRNAEPEIPPQAASHEQAQRNALLGGKRRQESPGKKRTDSGVGQLSGTSSEVSE